MVAETDMATPSSVAISIRAIVDLPAPRRAGQHEEEAPPLEGACDFHGR